METRLPLWAPPERLLRSLPSLLPTTFLLVVISLAILVFAQNEARQEERRETQHQACVDAFIGDNYGDYPRGLDLRPQADWYCGRRENSNSVTGVNYGNLLGILFAIPYVVLVVVLMGALLGIGNFFQPLTIAARKLRSKRYLESLKQHNVRATLYLRPFWADVIADDLEQRLAEVAQRDGKHLLVLGDDDEESGREIVRIEMLGDTWKSVMQSLSHAAETIVLLPSARPGTAWEIDLIAHDPALIRKTIVAIPSSQRDLPIDVELGIKVLGRHGFHATRSRDDELIPLAKLGSALTR